MANEIEIIVKSKDATGGGFRSATKEAKEFGSGLEKVGEGADNSEQKVLGLKDTVDGVATIMAGPGEQGIAAYLQGWADLASGVANFIVPATKAIIATGRQGVVTAITAVQQKAAAAASKAWAAAQWLLNAAMSANPIVLVVLAIAALVAAIVIAYKKSETFRNIVNGLWAALKQGAAMAINFVLGMIDKWLGGIQMILNAMGKLPGRFGAPFREAAKAVEAARGRVRALQASINATRGKTVTVAVNTGPSISKVKSIQNELASLHDRTVVVNVVRGQQSGLGGFNTGGGYAHGGIRGAAAAGGGPRSNTTLVGEYGRELVDLPPGSRVRSNPDTERILSQGSGGGVAVIEIKSGGSKLDDLLVEMLRKAVRVRGGNVQLVLGR